MTARGFNPEAPMDDTPAPCFPERVLAICPTCVRWRSALPVPADSRQFVILDASSVIPSGSSDCALHILRPAVRAFNEPQETDHEPA